MLFLKNQLTTRPNTVLFISHLQKHLSNYDKIWYPLRYDEEAILKSFVSVECFNVYFMVIHLEIASGKCGQYLHNKYLQ